MTRFDEISAAIFRRDTEASGPLQEQTFERLRAVFAHHLRGANSTWRELVERHGLSAAPLPRSAGELARWPLMTRQLLREGGFAERPNAAIFRSVSTSGSTQSAVLVPHNLEMSRATLGDNFLRLFSCNGVTDPFPFYGIAHAIKGYATGSQTTMNFMAECFGEAVAVGVVAEPREVHCQRLRALAPRTVASAPGVMTALANYLLEKGERLPIPRLVLGGAPLHIDDRLILERAFDSPEILFFYPTTDAGALGCSDQQTGDYVSFPETHIFEVVSEDGSHVAEGEEGLVAVTALDSLAAPIIRYLVGDRVTYLGRSARGERVRLRKIRRTSDALIGDLKVPLADLDGWRDEFLRRGWHTSALQLAKRRDASGRPLLILRLEAPDSPADIEAAALEVIRTDPDLEYAIRLGLFPLPRIEVHPPGGLLQGRFKLPIFVDESELP